MICIEITHDVTRIKGGAIGYLCDGQEWLMEGDFYGDHCYASEGERVYRDGDGYGWFRESLDYWCVGLFPTFEQAVQPGAVEAYWRYEEREKVKKEEKAGHVSSNGISYRRTDERRDGRPVYEVQG